MADSSTSAAPPSASATSRTTSPARYSSLEDSDPSYTLDCDEPLYNVSLRGTGYVAITTKGEPVALDVASAPTFGDAQAVVMWTAGVRMDVRVDTGGLGSMMRGGTGETLQMAFSGQGYVLVQPSESVVDGGHSQQQQGGAGGMLGQLLS